MDENNPTSTWSSRRKLIYTTGVVLFLSGISFLIFWKFWYTTPTCFDRIENGDESGVDCGGSCSLVCSVEALAPVVRSDPRFFEVYPGVYSVVVFVENHNINSSAYDVPYKFTFYDGGGAVVYEREGRTSLPKNKSVAVFEGNINIKGKKPERVIFELAKDIAWQKDLAEPLDLKVTHSSLLNVETQPKIDAVVQNNSLERVRNLEIVATIFDGRDNIVAASRTFINSLDKGAKTDVFFTWPTSLVLGDTVCEQPVVAELLLDRSGSMQSISKSPPEPLTSVKEAAKSFISLLKAQDRAGLVSFATTATDPSDSPITDDLNIIKTAIDKVAIGAEGLQYTNVSDALRVTARELASDYGKEARKIAIVLTDGVANRPADPAGKGVEKLDIAYAEADALKQSEEIKSKNIEIFTIGLGKDVHEDFLRNIASAPANYFPAPTIADLKNIYKEISSIVCKEVPARIDLNYKVLDPS